MDDGAAQLFRMLVEAGATPGKDFSCDAERHVYRMSERAYILLQLAYPELDLSQFASKSTRDEAAAATALNQQLGIDFTGRLLTRIEQRLQQLSPADAAWYLQLLLSGVEQRTGVGLDQLLLERLSPENQAWVNQLLEMDAATPCDLWMRDLVEAAGGSPEDVEIENDEVLLSEPGLALLMSVWVGEYDVSETIDVGDTADADEVDDAANEGS
ncbi:MAG: hypothetical protein AAFQ61_00750 [Cyanobacteria bacterium J06626_23]